MSVGKSKRAKAQRPPRDNASGSRIVGLDALRGDGAAGAFDTAAAIGALRAAGKGLPRERLWEAQELTFDAWDAPSARRRVDLATKALARHPWCGDAYAILADEATPQSAAETHLRRLAVAAAEFALRAELGPDVFEAYAGDFWGIMETRPYVRARAALSAILWRSGDRDEAVAIDLDILRLNPNDNLGARYVVADRLLVLGRDADLKALFDTYREDDSAFLSYSRALWSYRRKGDSATSRKLLTKALASNRHVPEYLLGRKPMPKTEPDYYEPGKITEAISYVRTGAEAWHAIPGALAWLAERAKPATPAKS